LTTGTSTDPECAVKTKEKQKKKRAMEETKHIFGVSSGISFTISSGCLIFDVKAIVFRGLVPGFLVHSTPTSIDKSISFPQLSNAQSKSESGVSFPF
jgi:hypothetical protein